jgi:LacI family transcriptional regulator
MITIKDIARQAGVSIGTVDRVLHKRGRFSPETARKIATIAGKTGYSPNVLARSLSLAKAYTFCAIIPKLTQDDTYWQLVADGFSTGEEEFARYSVRVRVFQHDRLSAGSFTTACSKALAAKPDGLILAPVSPRLVEAFVDRLPPSIPYVFLDSTLPDAAPLGFIGQDAFQSGVLAAKLVRLTVRDPGIVGIMRIHPDDLHIKERASGFEAGMAGCSGLRTVQHDFDGDILSTQSRQGILRALRQTPDLRALFVTNAHTHVIARAAIKAGLGHPVSVVGYDLVPQNVELVRTGAIDFLISQRPEFQGSQSVRMLFRGVVLQEPCARHTFVPMDIVTRENLEYYLPVPQQ